jgi:hypothetical protein
VNPETQYMGNPCKRGHDGLRWKNNGECVECHREQDRERKREKYRTDPEFVERERERARERWRKQQEKKSAKRRRLAKISRLAENPGASPAEREVARLKLAELRERMIYELGQRHQAAA